MSGRFSQGVCGDGAAILCDGLPMSVDEIVYALNIIPPNFKWTTKHTARWGKDSWQGITPPMTPPDAMSWDDAVRVLEAVQRVIEHRRHVKGHEAMKAIAKGDQPHPETVCTAERAGYVADQCEQALAAIQSHRVQAV